MGQRYDPETETLIPTRGGYFDVAGTICRDSFSGGAGGKPEGAAANHFIPSGTAVRRLTPRECERLQGFPDDYTLVPNRGKPAADGPRYKALGNSMIKLATGDPFSNHFRLFPPNINLLN